MKSLLPILLLAACAQLPMQTDEIKTINHVLGEVDRAFRYNSNSVGQWRKRRPELKNPSHYVPNFRGVSRDWVVAAIIRLHAIDPTIEATMRVVKLRGHNHGALVVWTDQGKMMADHIRARLEPEDLFMGRL